MSSHLERELKISRLRGQDIPREEIKAETRRFSDEACKGLEAKGYRVYPLTEQSIKTQKDAGRQFSSTWHDSCPNFEALTSRNSEVAIRKDQLFLPESNGKTLNEQLGMVAQMSADMSQQVKGTQVVIGEAPDYVELIFNIVDAKGLRLFGMKDFSYGYARTVTSVYDVVAGVGFFNAGRGLGVNRWYPDDRYRCLWVIPLVVPA